MCMSWSARVKDFVLVICMQCVSDSVTIIYVTYIFFQGEYTYMHAKESMGENLCVTGMHVD